MNIIFRSIISIIALSLLTACATPTQVPPIVQTVVVPQTVVVTPAPVTTATTASGAPRQAETRTVETRAAESSPTSAPSITSASQKIPAVSDIRYVAGSSQKVCQLIGETDRELNKPTVNQTETRVGLIGNDLGYSFEHNGKLFFLFGDSMPAATFNGKPNLDKDPPRILDDNDAIAFTPDTSIGPCIKLNFITDSIGAFKNPVVLNAQGKPAIALRVDEVPIAGISDGGKMYVIFATDNYAYPPGPTKGHLGFSTRTVVGVSEDEGNTFHYLYDFSKGPDAKFINVAIAQAQDGYLYFWGTQGGTLYRKSAPFLARKRIGSMNNANGIEYLRAVNPDGVPSFVPNENEATPLFHDYLSSQQTADCMGELGVEWNQFVKRWVMLYNCLNDTPANPRGVYMRLAEKPWGPWNAAQTIFNPVKDGGYCRFMHRAVNTQNPTPCDNLSDADKLDEWGGEYAPYFLSRFTTGDPVRGTSTFYYTLSTWNPYTEIIMKSTIQSAP